MGEQIDLKVGIYRMGLDYQVYRTTSQIPSECNSILFRNQGTSIAVIDNMVILQPGQTFDIQGNAGELLIRSFQVYFTNTGGQTNELLVAFKVFLDLK